MKYQKKMLIVKLLPIFLICNFSFAELDAVKTVNSKCPFSNNKVDSAQTLSYGVCCGNCLKKAAANVSAFIKKTKPNNKSCSFSAKPVRKTFTIGFCCSKCKKKAS